MAIAAALAAWSWSAPAAGPCTGALEPLRDEVHARIVLVGLPDSPAERVERRTLLRIERRLGRSSSRPARDVATLRRAADALGDLYPGDAAIGVRVDAALDGLHSAVALDLEDLLLTAPRLPAGPRRDRALGGAAVVGDLLEADEAAEGDASARLESLEAATLEVDATWRSVLDRPDRAARHPCGQTFTVREGGGLIWRATRLSVLHHQPTDVLQIRATRRRRPADASELFFEVKDFHGVGTYPIVPDTSLWSEGAFDYYRIIESGSVQVTRWDPDDGVVEGTFAFTTRGCVFGCRSTEVTDGDFATRKLRQL